MTIPDKALDKAVKSPYEFGRLGASRVAFFAKGMCPLACPIERKLFEIGVDDYIAGKVSNEKAAIRKVMSAKRKEHLKVSKRQQSLLKTLAYLQGMLDDVSP